MNKMNEDLKPKLSKNTWAAIFIFIFMFLSAVVVAINVNDTASQNLFILKQSNGLKHIANAMSIYQVDVGTTDTTYMRWKGGPGDVFLQKIEVVGDVTTFFKASDTWANRGTATYTAIND